MSQSNAGNESWPPAAPAGPPRVQEGNNASTSASSGSQDAGAAHPQNAHTLSSSSNSQAPLPGPPPGPPPRHLTGAQAAPAPSEAQPLSDCSPTSPPPVGPSSNAQTQAPLPGPPPGAPPPRESRPSPTLPPSAEDSPVREASPRPAPSEAPSASSFKQLPLPGPPPGAPSRPHSQAHPSAQGSSSSSLPGPPPGPPPPKAPESQFSRELPLPGPPPGPPKAAPTPESFEVQDKMAIARKFSIKKDIEADQKEMQSEIVVDVEPSPARTAAKSFKQAAKRGRQTVRFQTAETTDELDSDERGYADPGDERAVASVGLSKQGSVVTHAPSASEGPKSMGEIRTSRTMGETLTSKSMGAAQTTKTNHYMSSTAAFYASQVIGRTSDAVDLPLAKDTADTAVASCKYARHTLGTTLIIFIVGGLVGVLPLGMLAKSVAETIVAGDFVGANITNTTALGDVQYHRKNPDATIEPTTWGTDNAVDKTAALGFYALFRMWNAMSVFGSFWAGLALGWHGWKWAKRRPLQILIVGVVAFFGYVFTFDVLQTYREVDTNLGGRFVIRLPAYIIGGATAISIVICNPMQEWREALWPICSAILAGAVGLFCLVEAIKAYFSFQWTLSRLLTRTVLPAIIRSLWIHIVFKALLSLNAKYPKRKFLLMCQCLTVVTAACSVMQVGAASVLEAVIMEVVQVVLELNAYINLLRGETPLESSCSFMIRALRWLGEKLKSDRLPCLCDFLAEHLPLKPEESGDDTYLERRSLLAATAACGAVIEAACLALMFSAYVILPLRPNEIGKEPVPLESVMQLMAVSFFFEVCVSDVISAYVSKRLAASDPHRYSDITSIWVDIGDCKTVCIMCFIIVSCCMDILARFLVALCPAADSTGQHLMSLGRCPHFEYFNQ